MTGITFSLSLDLGYQLDLSAAINRDIFPLLNQSVQTIAAQTTQNWQEAILRARLWSGERDAYAKSVTWRMTGDFTAIVESDYQHAATIETGRPAYDLKRMLNTSVKVRTTENGKRFLVIPFRHNTPGQTAHANAMPVSVYQIMKKMTASHVVSQGTRPSGEVTRLSPKTGMFPSAHQNPHLYDRASSEHVQVNRNRYVWGGRLSRETLKGLGLDSTAQRHMQGMVRMQTGTANKTSSSSMTFRIMIQGQSGWVIPAQPGQYLAKKVVEDMRPKAQAAFAEAVRKTLIGQ